jgi:hypothetical protein
MKQITIGTYCADIEYHDGEYHGVCSGVVDTLRFKSVEFDGLIDAFEEAISDYEQWRTGLQFPDNLMSIFGYKRSK